MSPPRLEIAATLTRGDFTLEVSGDWPLVGCRAVYGPSGAGKSTLLRLIAGFERPDAGRLVVAGEPWIDWERRGRRLFVPAHRRSVGLVFQDGRVFPHLSVAGNLRYAERRSRAHAAAPSFETVVEAFALGPLLARATHGLSGGERQRVALARALLARPRFLLLDEPLSALDRARRADILPFLEDLPARFAIPTVLVSHSVEEVVRLADHTVILEDGRVRASGPTAAVLNADVAHHDPDAPTATILEGVVISHDLRFVLTRIDVGAGVIAVPLKAQARIGDRVRVRVPARHVALAIAGSQACASLAGLSVRNRLPATITALSETQHSPFVAARLAVGDGALTAEVTREAVLALGLAVGQPVIALIKSASLDL